MGMRRRIEAKVNATLAQASHTMSVAEREMLRASAKFNALLDEIIDGFDVRLMKKPGSTMLDFFKGSSEEFPMRVRLDLQEDEDK